MQVKYSSVIIFLFCKLSILGQSFSGHPSGLHWKKINSKEVAILFPAGLESKAEQVYHRIQQFYHQDSSLSSNRFKLNLVLQNQTVISNGYVNVGPFQSEFYLTPPHDPYVLGTLDWTEALTIHEYRHALQAMSSRRGINNILYHALGEEAWGASYGFVVPDWFAEGDAVHAETTYSIGGRGRMSSFLLDYRALNQGGKKWSYTKARNGSYKHLVPNHYVYGYTMVKYINDHFEAPSWGKILEDAVRYKGIFTPFKKALVRHTGLSPAKLYHEAIATLKSDPLDTELNDEILAANTKKNTVRDYFTANRLSNGSLLYLALAYDRLNALTIKRPNGKTKALTRLGITTDRDYGFKEPLATWSEITTDPRWNNRNYSDIILYNINTSKKKKITYHQKFFNPSPSHDLSKIVCMEYLPSGISNIVILDTTGQLLQSMPVEAGMISNFPIFERGDTSILSVLRGQGTSQVKRYFLSGRPGIGIIPPVRALLTNLMAQHDTIFFSSDISGRDNLYAFDPAKNKIFQLTDNSIGIQHFSVVGKELIYNYQSASGFQIRRKYLNACLFREVQYFDSKLPEKMDVPLQSRLSVSSPAIKDAGLYNNPFRVYSWSVRPDEGGNVFRILGINLMSTIQGSLAYAFNQNEKAHTVAGSLDLGTIYPLTSAVISKTYGRNLPKPSDPTKDSIRWNETGYRLGLSIPWRFYHGNTILRIQPSFQFGAYRPDYSLGERKNFQTTSFVRSGFTFSNQQVNAYQQVSSRFSQQLSFFWNRAINHGASSVDLNTAFNLPGITSNQVIELQADIHFQSLSDPYRFSNRTSFISGYEPVTSDRSIWLRAAYHLPLLYPDVGMNGFYFLKRIRSRLFGEVMKYTIDRTPKDIKVTYRSAGLELLMDGNLFNVLPVSFGIRYAQLLDKDLLRNTQKPKIEFIVEQLF